MTKHNSKYNNSFARPNMIQLANPIPDSPNTQLDKNTKKNPHLYPQVHQEFL